MKGTLKALRALRRSGAVVAALLFKLVRPRDFGQEETATTRLWSESIGTFVLAQGLNSRW